MIHYGYKYNPTFHHLKRYRLESKSVLMCFIKHRWVIEQLEKSFSMVRNCHIGLYNVAYGIMKLTYYSGHHTLMPNAKEWRFNAKLLKLTQNQQGVKKHILSYHIETVNKILRMAITSVLLGEEGGWKTHDLLLLLDIPGWKKTFSWLIELVQWIVDSFKHLESALAQLRLDVHADLIMRKQTTACHFIDNLLYSYFGLHLEAGCREHYFI